MEIQGNHGFVESSLAQKLLAAPQSRQQGSESTANKPQRDPRRDAVSLSVTPTDKQNGRLIRESEEPIENGIRIIQDFVTGDGRSFTRIQDFTQTTKGFQPDVIQQNASGSTTRLQEVLDRQENGFFRRTLHFTDGINTPQTRIENDFVSNDPFILSNGQNTGGKTPYTPNPYDPSRGTRLDISA